MSSVIPTGQSYREIDVTVSYGSSLGFETTDRDSALVSIKTDGQTIKILAFCRYSLIVLKAADGCSFGSELTPTKEDVTYEIVEKSASSIQLAVQNTNHSKDAKAKKLKLNATINGHAFCIQVNNPAYQQVDVTFNNGAFNYSGGDIDAKANPPAITFTRKGAAYFTLTGATFDTEPFFWENGKDDCIIDEGEDGSHAILTNLHEESDSTQHSFLLQVVDSQGHLHQSEDPTIVNIDPGGGN